MSNLSVQEKFWQGDFSSNYIDRNKSNQFLSANISMFTTLFSSLNNVESIIEFGCNVGMNLCSLRNIFTDLPLTGVGINSDAINHVNDWGQAQGILDSIVNINLNKKFDLTFTKVVLIHIDPDLLTSVYKNLYDHSNRYILLSEYYKPTPVSIDYRGESDKLFKCDFAGDMLEKYPDLKLLDYGFVYKHGNTFAQDEITCFLMEKV
ncbi:MAG: spore coat polysaccharide biosynthesis protein SpsF [Bermanella sp.]|jgi:spore coat polysaccharide biosynthesis protein SpsF